MPLRYRNKNHPQGVAEPSPLQGSLPVQPIFGSSLKQLYTVSVNQTADTTLSCPYDIHLYLENCMY